MLCVCVWCFDCPILLRSLEEGGGQWRAITGSGSKLKGSGGEWGAVGESDGGWRRVKGSGGQCMTMGRRAMGDSGGHAVGGEWSTAQKDSPREPSGGGIGYPTGGHRTDRRILGTYLS